MPRVFGQLVIAAALVLPLPLAAQVTAPDPAVKPELAPTGDTVAVPTAPPSGSVEAEVEAEVDKEIQEAEKAIGAAQSDVGGEDATIPSQTLDPAKIAPQSGG